MSEEKKGRALSIPPQTMEFLMLITQPEQLSHEASHAAFIKNSILADIRNKIVVCNDRGSY